MGHSRARLMYAAILKRGKMRAKDIVKRLKLEFPEISIQTVYDARRKPPTAEEKPPTE